MQLLIQPPRSPISWGFNNPCFAERLPDPSQGGIPGHPRPLASLCVWKLRLLNISETWNWPDIEQHPASPTADLADNSCFPPHATLTLLQCSPTSPEEGWEMQACAMFA
jgi:hypothetical protein